MATPGSQSLAERKRQIVRVELAAAAAELLREREYDAITVEDITLTAGVSRRTFFRYFSSKEDVFLATQENFGHAFLARLAARPPSERLGLALRAAFAVDREDNGQAFDLARVTRSTPALHARHLEHLALWRASLTTELAARSGLDAAVDARPALAAGIALATLDTAMTRWVEHHDARDLGAHLDECFGLVGDTLDALLPALGPAAPSA
jgi:AcrR family transcriptional regulator